jgi:hypothetical protein
MVMKNAMNHKHSRGACFSRDTASDLRLEKVSAPRRVDSTRSPSRPAMTAFCASLPIGGDRGRAGNRPFEISPTGCEAFDLDHRERFGAHRRRRVKRHSRPTRRAWLLRCVPTVPLVHANHAAATAGNVVQNRLAHFQPDAEPLRSVLRLTPKPRFLRSRRRWVGFRCSSRHR